MNNEVLSNAFGFLKSFQLQRIKPTVLKPLYFSLVCKNYLNSIYEITELVFYKTSITLHFDTLKCSSYFDCTN